MIFPLFKGLSITIRRLFRLGWPNFLETSGMWLGNFVLIVLVGVLSAAALASGETSGLLGSHMIAIRIEAMSFLPGLPIFSGLRRALSCACAPAMCPAWCRTHTRCLACHPMIALTK